MTWHDIIISQLIAASSLRARGGGQTSEGATLNTNAHPSHANETRVPASHARHPCLEGLIMARCCQIHLRMQPRWRRPFKWQHQGFVDTEPVKLGQGWGEDAQRDQSRHWYRFDSCMLPRRGGCFQRQKKKKLHPRGLSQQQLHLILGQRDGGRRTDNQKRRLWRGRVSINTQENLDTVSGLINEEAARWNEQEIKEAEDEACSLISSRTLSTESCSEPGDSHPFSSP